MLADGERALRVGAIVLENIDSQSGLRSTCPWKEAVRWNYGKNCQANSRFPSGMTTRRARTKAFHLPVYREVRWTTEMPQATLVAARGPQRSRRRDGMETDQNGQCALRTHFGEHHPFSLFESRIGFGSRPRFPSQGVVLAPVAGPGVECIDYGVEFWL